MSHNRQVRVAARPEAIPQPEHFEIVDGTRPEIEAGQILVRNKFLSVEPAMRGWLVDRNNYSEPVAIGAVMRSLAVGEVRESQDSRYQPGDIVLGWFGWQEWAAEDADKVILKFEEQGLSPSLALGVVGLTGVTALLALEKVALPRPGDVVLVSTAAGSVGSAVGQIVKLMDCRAVGIAGGAQKVRQCLDEFGFDAAIDYRSDDLEGAIAAACPDGLDIYFDNTAGAISDAVLRHLAIGARVVICGTASIQRWDPAPTGPRVERILLTRRASMQGFIVLDHMAEFPAASRRLAAWVREGKLKFREEIIDGIEHCAHSIADLYAGRNQGKRIIRI